LKCGARYFKSQEFNDHTLNEGLTQFIIMIIVHDGQRGMNEDELMGYSDVTIGFEGTFLL